MRQVTAAEMDEEKSWFVIVWSHVKKQAQSEVANGQQIMVIYRFRETAVEVIGAIPLKQEDEGLWMQSDGDDHSFMRDSHFKRFI
jgi:hypothetical protein